MLEFGVVGEVVAEGFDDVGIVIVEGEVGMEFLPGALLGIA